ncbi:hypothetical protein T492DRAFT_960393 [Pavlovales sp. CCMP2436]|nr:hypothetical protein T492DRAFT_960393 [Pavlovales sp. CCMP2436]
MPSSSLRAVLPALLCAAHVSVASTLPPVGATYERTLSLPVIGSQTLSLTILDSTRAAIRLDGALTLNEFLSYWGGDGEDALEFALSSQTISLLRRLGVALSGAEYIEDADQAWVTISPPLIPPIRIRLDRILGGLGRMTSA